VAMERSWGQPQAFGAARHGREIDRLDVNPVAVQERVGGGCAQPWIADHDRDDMTGRGHYRQAGLGQAPLQRRRALLVDSALDLAFLQMPYGSERTGR